MILLVLCHRDDLTSCDIMIVHPTSYFALQHRVQATSDPVTSHPYDYLLLLYHHDHLPLLLWHRYNTINFWSCKIMTIRPTSYIALRHHDCISNIWSWRITSVRPVTVIVPKWPFVQLLLFYNQLLILYWYWYIVTIWPRFDFVTRFDIMTMQETSDYGIGTTFTVRQTSHIGMRYKNAQQT